jgi:7-carboxy-7-deazaguanine synthase (Cx14CxxC type)
VKGVEGVSYSVKEIYYTLQGEGCQAGRPAIICRFAGCNLWSGLEPDRATAICRFCDTNFVGLNGPRGGRFESAQELARAVAAAWPGNGRWSHRKFVVCTGGEPLLQLDRAAIDALHDAGFEVAVETNGTITPPDGLDWICVSPKANAELRARQGSELKLVFPQADALPERFADLAFDHFFLQPLDGPELEKNVEAAVQYCLEHPQWRFSLQLHKVIPLRESGSRLSRYPSVAAKLAGGVPLP